MRKVGLFMAGAALLGTGLWIGSRQRGEDRVARETVPLPMLLRQVQSMGELRTARYSYENVFEHRTHLKPEGVLASLPGAGRIAEVATRNSALVSVDGTVDAGVDLTEARIEAGRIILPAPRIYEPQVRARMHQVRRGMFWRDENLSLDALRDAKERMAGAARQQGILTDAQRNAVSQVKRLVGESAEVSVAG